MSKVLEKIRKILAKADAARNDNAHEREIALRQAHALLAKHGLSMDDVEEVASTGVEEFGDLVVVEMPIVKREWIARLYNTIAQLNGVKVLRYSGHKPTIRFYGRALRIEVTKSIGAYLVDSIYRESKPYGRSSAQFALGAYVGIHGQVAKILNALKNGEIDGEQLSSKNALVVANKYMEAVDEADALMRSSCKRITQGTYQPTVNDRNAYSNGHIYGSNVAINTRVG